MEQSIVNNQLIGKNLIDFIINTLDNFPKLSTNWLLQDEGEMLRFHTTQNDQNGDNIQGHSINVNKEPEEYLLDIVHPQTTQLSKSQEQIDRLLGLLGKNNHK